MNTTNQVVVHFMYNGKQYLSLSGFSVRVPDVGHKVSILGHKFVVSEIEHVYDQKPLREFENDIFVILKTE